MVTGSIRRGDEIMLETYFEAAYTLRRLRAGLTGSYVDGYSEDLHRAGYARWTTRDYLRAAAHLGAWMEREGISLAALDEDALERFRQHLPSCRCLRRNRGKYGHAVKGARLFLEHLRRVGAAPAVSRREDPTVMRPLIKGFEHWMRRHRGVTESSLVAYRPTLLRLLDAMGDDPAHYDAGGLRRFVLDRAGRHGQSHAKIVVTATRMFVRYLVAHGQCTADLVAAIPTFAFWRLSSLPRYLPAEDVERIIDACDSSTPLGTRELAVVLLLSRLGLRAQDVSNLRLADIDWSDASLRVAGKGRRETRLPLPQDVGDAILAYLRRGRPQTGDDHVFIRSVAPLGPFRSSDSVSWIAACAIRRAGIEARSYGSHILRHSAATQMVRQGASLDTVRRIMRHRSVETTNHYAKVDVALLQMVAQPWPGEEVSPC